MHSNESNAVSSFIKTSYTALINQEHLSYTERIIANSFMLFIGHSARLAKAAGSTEATPDSAEYTGRAR